MASVILHTARHADLFHLRDDAVIGASLGFYGEWAEQELYLMRQLLKPGDTVIDVGANIGCHTLAFSRFVGPTGRVVSIEAQPAMFQLLAANVTANGASHVRCLLALADKQAGRRVMPLELTSAEGNYGSVSFADNRRPDGTVEGNVPVIVMMVDELALARCALIKVDVEGMEWEVLMGARTLIQASRPWLYFEQATDRHRADLFEMLLSIGYRLYWHVANPFNRLNFNGYTNNIFGGACEVNALAVPPGTDVPPKAMALGLQEIRGPAEGPAMPADAVRGWALPEDAYLDLPVRRSLSDWTSSSEPADHKLRHQLAQLQKAFDDLLDDRRKAQEIMEMQHRLLQERSLAGPT